MAVTQMMPVAIHAIIVYGLNKTPDLHPKDTFRPQKMTMTS